MSFLNWLGIVQGPRVGAIDVVAVRRSDDTIVCGPFHAKLNKGARRSDKLVVHLKVNNKDVNISMKLGTAGEAFFIERTREKVLRALRTSPISSPVRSPKILPLEPTIPSFGCEEIMDTVSIIPDALIESPADGLEVNVNRERSYSADDAAHPLVDESVSVDKATEVFFEDSRRQRSISDMNVQSTYLDSLLQTAPSSSSSFSNIDYLDASLLNTNETNVKIEECVDKQNVEIGTDRAHSSSWTWSWGEIPVKAKSKSSADLFGKGLPTSELGKAQTKDREDELFLSTDPEQRLNPTSISNMEYRIEQPPSPLRSFLPKSRSDGILSKLAVSHLDESSSLSSSAMPKYENRSENIISPLSTPCCEKYREARDDAYLSLISTVSCDINLSISPLEENLNVSVSNGSPSHINANNSFQLEEAITEASINIEINRDTNLRVREMDSTLPLNDNNDSSDSKDSIMCDQNDAVTDQEISGAVVEDNVIPCLPVPSEYVEELCTMGSSAVEVKTVSNLEVNEANNANKDSGSISSFTQYHFLQECEDTKIIEEGGTDGDILSLQDIAMEDISPGPAGGDLYDSDTDSYHSLSQDESEMNGKGFVRPKRYRYRKVLVPSKEQMQVLSTHLVDGKNEMVYELENCPPIKSELFLWSEDSRIVVIDVEGAITVNRKGSTWTSFLGGSKSSIHDGVTALLQSIVANGYHILYIAQNAVATKEQLEKIVADFTKGNKLPPGPVIHSPECLMIGNASTTRADLFKAAVLRGIKSLFPPNATPYYACFGTKLNDMNAFDRAGVPSGRIFIVDESTGHIRSMNRTMTRSFDEFNKFVNEMFPPYADSQARKASYKVHLSSVEDSYVDFNYWRLPIPEIILDC